MAWKINAGEHRRRQGWARAKLLQASVAGMALFVAAGAAASAAPQRRATPVGTWLVEDGSGNVRIARCGRDLCGYAANGKAIFVHMRRKAAASWSGTIRDIRDNSPYDGTISLKSADQLLIHGCVPGGGMCGDQIWTRVR